jgi:Xaa-Pro aminopeptidase
MSNLQKIQKALAPAGLDAILLQGEKNRYYATGFHSSDGMCVVTEKEAFFVTDSRYIEAARNQVRGFTIGQNTIEMPMKKWLEQIIADCGITMLGFEDQEISYADYEKLRGEVKTVLSPAESILRDLRAVKSPEEQETIRRAQALADGVFTELLGFIRPGMTEKRVAAEITYRLLLAGAEGNSFDPIVVGGPNSSMPHGVPGERVLQKGDFLTMDFGCLLEGYCSDMTRTIALGAPTDEMRRVYGVVLEAQKAGIAAYRAGVVGAEVDAAARKVISEAGYGEYFGHSFGHSLGLNIHERPSAAPSEQRELPAGAVLSAEPGIYLPGRFGVRIEDVCIVTEDGCENITGSPKELISI